MSSVVWRCYGDRLYMSATAQRTLTNEIFIIQKTIVKYIVYIDTGKWTIKQSHTLANQTAVSNNIRVVAYL